MTDLMPVAIPASWKGSTLDWRAKALHQFTVGELAEIDAALAHLRRLGDLDLPEITQDSFPLPGMQAYFRQVQNELRLGLGFVLLRGLPRERYSLDDMARIYYGLGVHLGRPGPQSWQGELLGNVIDVSDVEADPRGYHKGGGQRFHCDSCDVVGLMCLRGAVSGGASRIVSSAALHDALVQRRPDLAERLYRGYIYRRTDLDARFGEGRAVTEEPVPVFLREPDGFSCYYMVSYASAAAERGDAALGPADLEALHEMQRMAASEEFFLDMNFEEGDIQFLNNRTILHSRTDYVDRKKIAERRHLLRLWLQMPDWPAVPDRQILHTAGDRVRWRQQRRPHMEFPSLYLEEMARYLKEGRKLVAAT